MRYYYLERVYALTKKDRLDLWLIYGTLLLVIVATDILYFRWTGRHLWQEVFY